MGPVYATRLTILEDAKHPAETLHDSTLAVCLRWLRMIAHTYTVDIGMDNSVDVQVTDTAAGVTFTIEHLDVGAERSWRAVVVHPYQSPAQDVQMRIELQAWQDGSEETVTIRLLLGTIRDSVRPLAIHLERPALVAQLLDEFAPYVSSGNMRATRYADFLQSEAEIDELAGKILQNERFLPIVVISRDTMGELVCSREVVEQIALHLAGLGRVYVLPTHASGSLLRKYVTDELGCLNGDIRLYWPEFRMSDQPFSHHLWNVEQLRSGGAELLAQLPREMFGLIAAASAAGIGSDRRVWNVYRVAQEAKTQAIIDRRDELAKAQIAASEDDYLDAVTRLDQLKEEVAGYNAAFEHLALDNAASQSRFDQEMRTRQAKIEYLSHELTMHSGVSAVDLTDLVDKAVHCTSVGDAMRFFEEHLADPACLVFLKSSFDTADDEQFNGKLRVAWDHLFTMQRAAKLFHDDPTAQLKEVMMAVGMTEETFKTNVSDKALRTYKSRYRRRYVKDGVGTNIELGPHISNGKGNAGLSLYVYWYVDRELRKFVVGHVGPKLRDDSGGY